MIQAPYMPLDTFPEDVVHAGTDLFRCHRRGLWWFASDEGGRFNLETPDGTCYFGLDRATAVREVLRDELVEGAVTMDQVKDRWVSTIPAPATYRVADANHDDAQHFGATNALSAQGNQPAMAGAPTTYDISRVWATEFRAANFDGIRYSSHFTSTNNGIALFGDAGARPAGASGWPVDPKPEPLIDTCRRNDVKVRVLAVRPPSTKLTFL